MFRGRPAPDHPRSLGGSPGHPPDREIGRARERSQTVTLTCVSR